MFFDPLEQFNIIPLFIIQQCAKFSIILDNVSIIGLWNISFFFILYFVFLTIKFFKGEISWGVILYCIVKELKAVLHSNMAFKKQIFLGYLICLFFFILFSNVFGMLPYNVTVTSYFVLSFFFALITFISVTIVGIRYHRFKILQLLLPNGVPLAISLGLVLIELISFVSRVLSLSIRLFANMMSGHTLLKILLGFSWTLMTKSYTYALVGFIPLLIVLAVTFLESMIAFLQAYIFIVLSSIYFNDVVNLH